MEVPINRLWTSVGLKHINKVYIASLRYYYHKGDIPSHDAGRELPGWDIPSTGFIES
jgi:hypothetical protein